MDSLRVHQRSDVLSLGRRVGLASLQEALHAAIGQLRPGCAILQLGPGLAILALLGRAREHLVEHHLARLLEVLLGDRVEAADQVLRVGDRPALCNLRLLVDAL